MSTYDFSRVQKWLADNPEKPPLSILLSISKKFELWPTEKDSEVADPTDQREEVENVTRLTKSQEVVSDSKNAMRIPYVNSPAKRSRGNRQGGYTLW